MTQSTLALEAAFSRTKLPEQGYTFQTAINCVALKICIERLAVIDQRRLEINQKPTYWWDKF